MVDNGPNPDSTVLSKEDLEVLVDDGLQSIHALQMHMLANKSMFSLDEWLSISNAQHALVTIRLKRFK